MSIRLGLSVPNFCPEIHILAASAGKGSIHRLCCVQRRATPMSPFKLAKDSYKLCTRLQGVLPPCDTSVRRCRLAKSVGEISCHRTRRCARSCWSGLLRKGDFGVFSQASTIERRPRGKHVCAQRTHTNPGRRGYRHWFALI